ncbi:hypothetical protein [Nocardioides pyridinolyticus]
MDVAADQRVQIQLRRSEFAAELAKLPASVRRRYGITTPVLVVLDGLVAFCWPVLDESDNRGWLDKVEDVADMVLDGYDLSEGDIDAFIADLAEIDVATYVETLPTENFRRFFQRLVGAAAYHRLSAAFTKDSAPVVTVSRIALSAVAPYIVAWDDLTAELSETQLSAFKDIAESRGAMLPMMAALFRLLDSTVVHLDIPETWSGRATLTRVGEDEMDLLRAEMRELTAGRSREAVKDLSATLSRKLAGAKDALAHSSDSVSQAANSLIELVDRLLRVFTDDEVLEWLDANYPSLPETTYVDGHGRVRPSKRGQALCLVHAGEPAGTAADMNIVAAIALTRTRRNLQQLKHADEGTAAEKARVVSCMQEIESFLFPLTGFTWATVSDEALDRIRYRLIPKRDRADAVRSQPA